MFYIEKLPVYEIDIISKIISLSISEYQRLNRKKVVLIIEDLDRIEPAHLFRILNVLSAHMDYEYRMNSSANRVENNKFGFDNIIIAVDFQNFKSIYAHFYGKTTDYQGYISKFLSSNYFQYSIKKIEEKYIVDKIAEITTLSVGVIKEIFNKNLLGSNTIREIVHSFEISAQIPKEPIAIFENERIPLNTSFLKVIAILKRLKIDSVEIAQIINATKTKYDSVFYQHIGAYMFEEQLIKQTTPRHYLYIYQKDIRQDSLVYFSFDKNNGLLSLTQRREYPDNTDVKTDFNIIINRMIEMVV